MTANNLLKAVTLLLVSLCIILSVLTASCGDNPQETITPESTQTETAETAKLTGIGYDYSVTDLGGATVTFLNADQMWQMNMVVMLEEDDGSDAAL